MFLSFFLLHHLHRKKKKHPSWTLTRGTWGALFLVFLSFLVCVISISFLVWLFVSQFHSLSLSLSPPPQVAGRKKLKKKKKKNPSWTLTIEVCDYFVSSFPFFSGLWVLGFYFFSSLWVLCFICRQPFVNVIVTKCQHYFCEHCALKVSLQFLWASTTSVNYLWIFMIKFFYIHLKKKIRSHI